MSERRLENRFLCAELVTVDWVAAEADSESGSGSSIRDAVRSSAGKADTHRTVEAILEDISALGACVQVEDRIPLGATISISSHQGPGDSGGGARFSGYVSYCEYRDFGYFVGIRLSEETPWSTGAFEPEHLTNLAAMSRRASGRTKRRSPVVLSSRVH